MELANEVVAWGYSLPVTDFFSEWLLRHARSSRCKRLVLINPQVIDTNSGTPRLNEEFISRFVNAVRRPGRTFEIQVFSTFDDFQRARSAVSTPSLNAQLRALARGRSQPRTAKAHNS